MTAEPDAERPPLRPAGLCAEELIARRKHLPNLDADALRRDIDSVLDIAL